MGCNPFLEWLLVSIDFNENYVAGIMAALTLYWRWRLVWTGLKHVLIWSQLMLCKVNFEEV